MVSFISHTVLKHTSMLIKLGTLYSIQVVARNDMHVH